MRGEKEDQPDIKRRARLCMRQMHPDRLGEKSEIAAPLIDLLQEINTYPDDLDHWSPDIRERHPLGSEVTLIGVAPDHTVREPLSVPLRRPRVFLQIVESYLRTGTVPPEMIADADEGSTEETVARHEVDETVAMFRASIKTAAKSGSIEHLVGIRLATKVHSRATLAAGGIFRELDEEAKKLITREIGSATTPDTLQIAANHIKLFDFSDKRIAQELLSALEARATQGTHELFEAPSRIDGFESRAAAARTLPEMMRVAVEAREHEFPSEDERRRVRKSIDTLAKNLFVETCNGSESLDTFTDALAKARQFPFFEEQYGKDVLSIIETRAKYFMLSKVAKSASPDDALKLEHEARSFPFSDEHVRDIEDEILKKRADTDAEEGRAFKNKTERSTVNRAFEPEPYTARSLFNSLMKVLRDENK